MAAISKYADCAVSRCTIIIIVGDQVGIFSGGTKKIIVYPILRIISLNFNTVYLTEVLKTSMPAQER